MAMSIKSISKKNLMLNYDLKDVSSAQNHVTKICPLKLTRDEQINDIGAYLMEPPTTHKNTVFVSTLIY
jgi:hypothetical protein